MAGEGMHAWGRMGEGGCLMHTRACGRMGEASPILPGGWMPDAYACMWEVGGGLAHPPGRVDA